MKLAVLIPTFNRPRELRACVDSVLPTLTEDARIIVVDDASNDGEQWASLRALSRISDQVEVVSLTQRHGCTRARKVVLDEITAEYVVILDDDASLIQPDDDILAKIVSRFEHEPRLAVQAFPIVEPWGRKVRRGGDADGRISSWFTNCGCAFRMAAYRDVGGYPADFDSPYGEEQDLAIRLLDRGWLIRQFETPLVFHCKSPVSRSTWQSERGRMLNYLRFAWRYHPLWFAIPYTMWLLQKRARQGLRNHELWKGALMGFRDFADEFSRVLRQRRVSGETLKQFYGLQATSLTDAAELDALSQRRLPSVLYSYMFR